MLQKRIIPVLLIDNRRVVKTVCFKDPVYIGDPVNTVRILNDKNIPELIVLDITAGRGNHEPDYDLVAAIAGECNVPMVYGGGINSVAIADKIFNCGVEKVALNTAVYTHPTLVSEIAGIYGSQSVVVSVDTRQLLAGFYKVFIRNGTFDTGIAPGEYVRRAYENGCGEILLTSIDLDGTFRGYDLPLISQVSSLVTIPVIACGGAGSTNDLHLAIDYGAAAAAAGSLFCFNGRHKAVLISYPFGK